MRNSELKIYLIGVVGLLLISNAPNCFGFTLPSDVEAITSFYESLSFPELNGWVTRDGDPCKDGWQGVQCESYFIVSIVLKNLGIRGQLSHDLGTFSAIKILDLSHNYIWGNIPVHLPPTLKILSLNNNTITGTLTDAFYQLKDLTYLNVSENNLGSPLPPSMANLTSLSTFHIQRNYMTGSIDVLRNSPLIDVDLDNNFFSGTIPPNLLNIPNFSHRGCNLTFPSSIFMPSSKNVIIGFLILVFLALGLCMLVSRWSNQNSIIEVGHHKVNATPRNDNGRNDLLPRPKVRKKKKEAISNNPPPEPLTEIVVEQPVLVPTTVLDVSIITDLPRSFSISSLQQYTDSFSQENIICRGSLGAVYRARLPDETLLAVMKLENADLSDEDFMKLVSNVSKIQNDNIVGLVGYCCEHGEQYFVYKHCNNGTLHEALHQDEDLHKKLSWKTRVKTTLQTAKALEYLHEAEVVHQNFKSANIMLDEELKARVFYCGLAPVMPSSYISKLHASGYGAPELESGRYTYQSDVYSFGVVMLELLTGRKALHRSKTRGDQYLVKWAVPKLHDIEALSRMVDPSLDAAYSTKSLSRFADIISLCVQDEPEFRPPMSEIVQYLEHMTKMRH